MSCYRCACVPWCQYAGVHWRQELTSVSCWWQGWCIQATKTRIHQIMAMMQAENPKADMRFAFVGYRDHINGPRRIVVQEFTSSVNELHAFLHAVHVISNNDACEDIAGGLEVLFLRQLTF